MDQTDRLEVPGIVLSRLGQPPELETVQVSEPGPGEVLVRIVASGICHTDLGYMEYARAVPVILGHEGAGIVVRVGAGVRGLTPRDHVVINWQPKCGRCPRCLSGRSDLCEAIRGTAAPHIFWKDAPLHVMLNAGTFSPYVVVPENGAVRIPLEMPLDKAALLGCGVATGVGAVLYTAQVQPGEDVAIIGAGGGVGLNVVQGARLALARRVIAIDIDAPRLELARRMGATHGIDSTRSDPVKEVLAITHGRGVEHVFEVVGRPELMAAGIGMLARGGALTLIGAAGREESLAFQPRRFMSMQQRILGCIYGNVRPELDLPHFADWYLQGKLYLDELITQTVALEEVPEIFTNPGRRGGIRTVILFERGGAG